MTEPIRKYKEVMLWFTRDERIEERDESIKANEVIVETHSAIRFPDYSATKINILV